MRLKSLRPTGRQPAFHHVAVLPTVAEDGLRLLNIGIRNGAVRADDGLESDVGKLADEAVALGVGLGAWRANHWAHAFITLTA